MMNLRGIGVGAILMMSSFALPHGLRAQEEVEPDTIAPIPLAPVVVTVLRTPFVLTEVPYAVAVNGRAEIQRAKPGLGLDEALFGIPGIQVDNRYNYALGERISIRGFGARAQFGVRGVKVIVDGIPATLPDGQTTLNHVDLGSLGRAEVIRGPASALYGNAAGGVIQLETEPPPPVPLGQEFMVIAGENGLLRLQSATGGRSGRWFYLMNLSRLGYGGYREFNSAENLLANARLGYGGERSAWALVVNFVDYDAQNPGALSEALLRENRTQAFSNNLRQRTGEKGRQGQLGLTWRRALGPDGELELSGFGLGRTIVNPIPPRIIDLNRAAGGVRALYRSRTAMGAPGLQWVAGVEVNAQLDDRRNFANDQGERGRLALDQEERVTSAGAFAQIAAPLAPRLDLLASLRYDRVRFRAEDRFLRDDTDDSGSRVMDAVSPSVGLTYAASGLLNLYGNWATAFGTPTTTELANRPSGAGGFNPELEPQRTVSFETGARGHVGGRVAYQLAAYRARVANALIPFEIPQTPGRQFFRNAGSSVHQGVEAGASWAPARGVLARLAYTYIDARFDEYVVEGTAFNGNRIPGVAPHRLEAGLSYDAADGWLAAIETRHASRMPVNDENTSTAFSPSFTVADLRTGWNGVRISGIRATPFVGVTNVFDVDYNTSVVVNAFGGRFYEPGPGRAFYGGMRVGLGFEGR
ncbi:MAG: TonB-dependent receptor [Gemmatimonadota bacterium]|nr:TonB-dependent receptor [Gemmatimonadota bacterium]